MIDLRSILAVLIATLVLFHTARGQAAPGPGAGGRDTGQRGVPVPAPAPLSLADGSP